MKKIFQQSLLLSSLLLVSQTQANDLSTNNLSVGLGSYAFTITNEDNSNADIEFGGFNVSAGLAFNNHFQVRGSYFTLENENNSQIESTGFDLMAYGGTGFSEPGFRGYGGAGFYSDKWNFGNENESFSGFQFGGGIGYNWGPVALDFVVHLRQADKYEDTFSATGTYVAGAGGLTLSYLF